MVAMTRRRAAYEQQEQQEQHHPTQSSKLSPNLPSLSSIIKPNQENIIPGIDYDLPTYQCPSDPPERVQFPSALASYLFNLIANITLLSILYPIFESMTTQHIKQHQNYHHPIFATILIFYYLFALVVRWIETDAHVFYEHCWACNFVMLVSAYGMITNSPLCTGMSCVIVAVDQMCWYIDLAGFVLTGKYHVGVAKYLSNPNISKMKKITAWHHIWFLPLMLYTLHWQLPQYSFTLGSIAASLTTLLARPSIPFYCLSLNRDESNNNKYKLIYLNVNCPYAFWEDIPFSILHIFNHKAPYLYIPYLYLIANFLLNLPAVLILTLILMPFNGNYNILTFS